MFKQWRIAFIMIALAMLSVIISACGASTGGTSNPTPTPTSAVALKGPTCVAGTISASGSTALQPLAQDVATNYQQKCSGSNITVGPGGSGTGLKNAESNTSTIGDSDVYSTATDQADLVDHQVAVVVFAVVINSKVTGVTNLTAAQLKDIYTGKTTNWNQINSSAPNLKIIPISRTAGSGTRVTFAQFVLGGPEALTSDPAANPIANASNDVANAVSSTDGSVAYVAADFATKHSLTVVTIDGVQDTPSNVQSNTYKFWNVEHMYTKGEATGLAKAFIDYMASADTASIRKTDGFLDLSSLSAAALDAKKKV